MMRILKYVGHRKQHKQMYLPFYQTKTKQFNNKKEEEIFDLTHSVLI